MERPTLAEVLEAGTLEGVELDWSDTLFQMLDWIGRSITLTVRAEGITTAVLVGEFSALTWLEPAEVDAPDEVAQLLIDGAGSLYLHRPEFVFGMWEGGEFVIDAGSLTLTLGGVGWVP